MRSFRAFLTGGVFCAALLASAQGALASGSGGLAQPFAKGQGMFGVTLGYSERDVDGGSGREEAESRRLLFKGAFGFGNGFDGYALLGFSDLKYSDADFSGSLGELIGLGVRYGGLLLGEGPGRLVLDFQWEYYGSEDGNNDVKVDAKHLAAYVVREFGAAGKVGYFYPYGGLRYSVVNYSNDFGGDFHEDQRVGLFGGADYFVSPNVFFSGEMHVFDEESVLLSAGYRF